MALWKKQLMKMIDYKKFSAKCYTPLRRVVVTGIGAVTPLGKDVQTSWLKLLAGKSSITTLDDTYKNLPCRIAAKIDKTTLEIEKHFTKTDIKCMSEATLLAILASEEALFSANLNNANDKEKEKIGVCVGMGMFDLSEVYKTYQNLEKGYNRVSPFFIPKILPNMACGHISMRYSFRGPNHTVSTACATGAHAIGDAFRFIRNGDADIMIAGSAESCIDPLSIAGFCRLRALSTSFNDDPLRASRPFDKARDGFVMGEGAAILILEELESAKKRNVKILAEIIGYGLSGDAYHLTSPSVDGYGAQLAMKRAVDEANLKFSDIGYVNAHATSTPTGDKIEAKAINSIFGEGNVEVSSTKGAHGHLLGASGNLETLFVVKACSENILPPSINIEELDNEIKLNIVKHSKKWETKSKRVALKNSFGFGGTNACLCVSSYDE